MLYWETIHAKPPRNKQNIKKGGQLWKKKEKNYKTCQDIELPTEMIADGNGSRTMWVASNGISYYETLFLLFVELLLQLESLVRWIMSSKGY